MQNASLPTTISESPRIEDLQDRPDGGFIRTTDTYGYEEGATTTCYFMPAPEHNK
jgi:hypothetical protein